MSYPKFSVGTLGIILNRKKQPLFVRTLYGAKQWQLPGGFLKSHESPEDCLKRELKEELNIKCKVGAFLGGFVKTYQNNVTFVYRVHTKTKSFMVDNKEIAEFAFFDLAKPKPRTSPRNLSIARHVLKLKKTALLVFESKTFRQPG